MQETETEQDLNNKLKKLLVFIIKLVGLVFVIILILYLIFDAFGILPPPSDYESSWDPPHY